MFYSTEDWSKMYSALILKKNCLLTIWYVIWFEMCYCPPTFISAASVFNYYFLFSFVFNFVACCKNAMTSANCYSKQFLYQSDFFWAPFYNSTTNCWMQRFIFVQKTKCLSSYYQDKELELFLTTGYVLQHFWLHKNIHSSTSINFWSLAKQCCMMLHLHQP